MVDLGTESPQPRHYRRHESMKEYRDVKAGEKKQKIERATRAKAQNEALKVLTRDKPDVHDRVDLENLAKPDERSRIYETPKDDPVIKDIDKRILYRVNTDERLQKLQKTTTYDNYLLERRRDIHDLTTRAYDQFILEYPDKALAYAKPREDKQVWDTEGNLIQDALDRKKSIEDKSVEAKAISNTEAPGNNAAGSVSGDDTTPVADQEPVLSPKKDHEGGDADKQVSETQIEEVTKTTSSEEDGEGKLIYAESFLDPEVRKIYLEVRKETDENSQVKRAENPMVPSYIDTWNQVRNEIGSERWDQFVIDYPEKAQAYAKNDKWIKAALERLNGVSEPSGEQEFKLRRNDKSNGADKWYGQGDLRTEADVLIYSREHNKPTNIFAPDSKLYDQEEERLAKNYSPRMLGLAVVDAALSGEAGREVKIPSVILWKILETNPKELGTKTAVRLGSPTSSSLLERFSPIHVQRWRETTFNLPDNDVRTLKPFELKVRNSDGDERTIEVNSSWKKLTVDQKTLTAMQKKAVEYIEQQVNLGNMPADILDAARGLMLSHQAQDTVRFAPFKKKAGGESPASPREHTTLLQHLVPDVWTASGSLRQDGRNIVYENDNLRRKKDARSVQIATADTQDETRIFLTRQAWDILESVPNNIKDKNDTEYRINMPNALTNPTLDRQGLWKRFVKPFAADSDTLMKMQGMIRDYVADNVAKETMDESFLKAVDGIIKYKHSIYPGTL